MHFNAGKSGIARFGFAAIVFAAAAGLCLGQSAGGVAGLSGVVKDPSGSSVPHAKVVISSTERGALRSLETNADGIFSAPALNPGGGYKITVTAPGFAQYEANDIVLQVGQDLNLTIPMAVGQTSTSVEVSAAAQLLNDTKSDVSQVVGTREIMELPINGRRVDAFVLNAPGVTNDGTFGLLTFRGVEGNNSFLLDGNDNTEQFYDENAGRTRIYSQISADAVQEFQVVSSNVSAEYGRAMGGVVNTVTKSGTNATHGSGFYFLRSTGFDAHDPYSAFNPSDRRWEAGASLGGAIIKNKLFYFLSTDNTRRNFPIVDSLVKATFIDTANQVWLGCTAPATPAQCSAINALLPRFFGITPRTAINDLYFGRLDYHLNDRNTFNVSFNFLRWLTPNGIQSALSSTSGAGLNNNGDDSVTVRNGKVGWTSVISNNMVNSFRYGLDTDRQADTFDPADLAPGLGYLSVTVAGVQVGNGVNYIPRIQPMETRNEWADDVTWVHGKHTVKAGASYEHVSENINNIANRFGSYTYATPTLFAEDYSGNTGGLKNYSNFSQTFGNPQVNYLMQDVSFYLQDQWKVTDRLTVTAGARYEYTIAPPSATLNPLFPQTGNPIHTGPLDLMPRIGVAYRVNDKTVVRAGVGTYFARLVGGLISDVYTGNGLFQSSLSLSTAAQIATGPVFPNGLPSGPPPGSSVLDVLAPNLKTPYSEQGSIAVERQIGKDMVLTVSGIFSRGVNLYGTTDINAAPPSGSFTYTIADASGNPVGSYTTPVYTTPRPNPSFSAIYQVGNGVSSWYDGLAVTFEKRFSHGFQSLASYTWSHEIDDGQGTSTNAVFGFSTAPWTYNGNYGFDKGSGLIDQRHRFVYEFVWAPTFMHSNNWVARYVVNNWQLASIATLASGRPTGSETIKMNDTPVPGMLYSSSEFNGFNGNFRVPFVPLNSLYTPWIQQENLRLTKNVPLWRESLKLSLNAEVFNLANNWSPTTLATQAYSEAKGVLTYTPTAFGFGLSDGGFPDGTQARRLQISARLTF